MHNSAYGLRNQSGEGCIQLHKEHLGTRNIFCIIHNLEFSYLTCCQVCWSHWSLYIHFQHRFFFNVEAYKIWMYMSSIRRPFFWVWKIIISLINWQKIKQLKIKMVSHVISRTRDQQIYKYISMTNAMKVNAIKIEIKMFSC